MAWTKVVTESASGKIAQEAASLLNQGALATLDSVASGQIDANAVGGSELASGAVGTLHLANNSVTNANMSDDAIGLDELSATGTASGTTFLCGDNSWATPTDISTVANLTDTTIDGTPANNEVLAYDTTASKWLNQNAAEAGLQPTLMPDDVTSSMIGSGTVSLSNMANLTANTLIGRDTESTGVPEELSVSAVKAMLSLDNVANTTDAGKPVSTAQQTEIDTKAELAGDSSQDFSVQNLSVTGNLSITGTSEIRNTTTETINVADNTIVLNSDKSATADVDAGIVVERGGDGNNKSIYWDEGDDKWKFGDSASAVVAGTYQGDVVSMDVNSSYASGSTVVPVGHFQFDGTSLYVRTS